MVVVPHVGVAVRPCAFAKKLSDAPLATVYTRMHGNNLSRGKNGFLWICTYFFSYIYIAC